MAVQYTGHVIQTRDNNTAPPLVGVLVTGDKTAETIGPTFLEKLI